MVQPAKSIKMSTTIKNSSYFDTSICPFDLNDTLETPLTTLTKIAILTIAILIIISRASSQSLL